jgi:ABC-2 type transport system ATP-binding protein
VIEVENLVYEYPSKRALKGIGLSVRPNTITALVGPNGAGKTTLLRCLAALDTPYDGTVHIAGLNTRDSPRAIHALLGYLPDFYGLYDALSVERCLIFAALAHGFTAAKAKEAAVMAAERVGLSDRLANPAAELSRGLRQRLAIAQAIVHEPKVVLLDEPAAGLDPMARRDLSKLLVSLKESGMTLVVSWRTAASSAARPCSCASNSVLSSASSWRAHATILQRCCRGTAELRSCNRIMSPPRSASWEMRNPV